MSATFSPMFDASRLDRFRSAIRSAIGKPQEGPMASEAGKVLMPERDLKYVNAYGPTAKA